MSDLDKLDGQLGRLDEALAKEHARKRAMYGGLAAGFGLSHMSLVLDEAEETGWGRRLDSIQHLREHFQRILESEDAGLSPGGLIAFSPDLSHERGLAGRIFSRIANWLRRVVPEAVPFLGPTVPVREMQASARAGGVGATTMHLADTVNLKLITTPAEGLWTDPKTGQVFTEGSFVVWIAGVEADDLRRMAEEIKQEFRQKAVMYVPLETRRVYFV